MTPDRSTRRYLLWSGLFLGFWTVLALLFSVGTYQVELGQARRLAWGPLLRQEFKCCYAWGLVSLGVLWFCSRNALKPKATGRWALAHFAASFFFSGLYLVFSSWLIAGETSVMHPEKILTFSYLIKVTWVHNLVTNFFMYWLVVFAHLGWHYYQHYKEHQLQTAELQRELVEARLAALRMQLNPHFLFNTLHTVSALIHENPDAADRVVARLSDLLRLTLDASKPQEVPLSEEMEFLDRYLQIEQTRFTGRLKIDKQIEPAALPALVPYLILQPLVENAIRHGIEPREESGVLSIQAHRRNGRIELRIRDDGAGLGGKDSEPLREGIGLSNTRSRLRHLYGEDFRFELLPRLEGGLEACVDIPYRTDNGEPAVPGNNSGVTA